MVPARQTILFTRVVCRLVWFNISVERVKELRRTIAGKKAWQESRHVARHVAGTVSC